MRVPFGQVASLLRDPASLTVLLLYGNDQGLIRERSLQAAKATVGPHDDPFRFCTLARDEHGRVLEEALALSLTRGRRVVRVLDASDGLVSSLSRLSDNPVDALVILEGGGLPARSKLRALAEKRPAWAAVACYAPSAVSVMADVRAVMQSSGVTIAPEALQALAAALPHDTAAIMSEVHKLITYAGPSREIDTQSVAACCGYAAEFSLSALFEAALGGDIEAVGGLADQAIGEGATGAGLIAALSGHVQRLLKLRLLVDGGAGAETACGMLVPPVFPRQQTGLLQQLRMWSHTELVALLGDLKATDLACKRAGSRDAAICSHLMLVTALRAFRNRRGRGLRPA